MVIDKLIVFLLFSPKFSDVGIFTDVLLANKRVNSRQEITAITQINIINRMKINLGKLLGRCVSELDFEFLRQELHDMQHVHIDHFFNVVGTRAVQYPTTGAFIVRVFSRRPFAFLQGVEVAEVAARVGFLYLQLGAD
jgi:hypothetical protein